MTSLLARLGHLETRSIPLNLWSNGKRKRSEGLCRGCTARRALRQTRAYSDDSLKAPVEGYFTPLSSQETADNASVDIRQRRASVQSAVRGLPAALGLDGGHSVSTPSFDFSSHQNKLSDGARPAAYDQEPVLSRDQLWERFEQPDEALSTPATQSAGAAHRKAVGFELNIEDLPFDRKSSLLDLDYAATLPMAVLERDVDLVARCLFAADRANDFAWIHGIPPTTFSSILKLLEPANSIDRLSSAHLDLSEAAAKRMGLAPMNKVAYEYKQILQSILVIRRKGGIALTFADYKTILRSARDLGHRNMAVRAWTQLLGDGHKPDVDCYNLWMHSVLSAGFHKADTRHNSRVTPFHMLARKRYVNGPGFTNFRVGRNGVKKQVMSIFSSMLRDGATANEESFRIVIMAVAREGDVATLKSVLRKVWHVDTDALLAGKDESEILPRELSDDSPLYPTPKLLFTIAHAFGINSDIPAALRLVDFIARHYSLEIPVSVWAQLFEWTFVLSVPRRGAKPAKDGTRQGLLPLQSVLSLWETMTGAPYHVQPTMSMYNQLMKNLRHRDMLPMMIEKMEEGLKLHIHSRERASSAYNKLYKAAKHLDASAPDVGASNTSPLQRLRTDYELADLIRRRNHFWLKRWVRFVFVTSQNLAKIEPGDEILLRTIPRLMWTWRAWASSNVKCYLPGGTVEFQMRSGEEMEVSVSRMARHGATVQELLAKVPKFVGGHWLHDYTSQNLPVRLRGTNNEEDAGGKAGQAEEGRSEEPLVQPGGVYDV